MNILHTPLNLDVLKTSAPLDERETNRLLENEISDFKQKIIVLDDDPTGTQTVHDVFVYTDWSKETLLKAFQSPKPLFFILTNSRSFSTEQTKQVHQEIGANILWAAKKTNQTFTLISRGDSTLRGHYPLETQVLRETLETNSDLIYHGEIICPFFPEGGRFTLENIHYVKEGTKLIPAGESEFAKDKTFGYQSSHLGEYVEEKSNGIYKKENCIYISLEEVRTQDINGITQKLLLADNFSKVIVNATTYTELKVFMIAFIRATSLGKNFLIRSAAAFPKIIGMIPDMPLLKKEDVAHTTSPYGGLVIIGSHVKKTTQQLNALQASSKDLTFIEFNVNTYFEADSSLELETSRIVKLCKELISKGKHVVIYTSRELKVPASANKDIILALSVEISKALTNVVKFLDVQPQFIIAKGGITSSDVATIGLGIEKAFVLGQIKSGIPVWETQEESKFPHIPYIIFPGNVGEVSTLQEIVEELM